MSDFKPGQTLPGFRLRQLDPSALAKAEAALKSLSGNFAEWLANEVTKLDAAWAAVRSEGVSVATAEGKSAWAGSPSTGRPSPRASGWAFAT